MHFICIHLFFFSPDMPKPPEDDLFILPDEYKFIPRNKRAVVMKTHANQKLNVETLVVVDRKMMDNHGHENITTYVLTVLNMVRENEFFYLFFAGIFNHPKSKLSDIIGSLMQLHALLGTWFDTCDVETSPMDETTEQFSLSKFFCMCFVFILKVKMKNHHQKQKKHNFILKLYVSERYVGNLHLIIDFLNIDCVRILSVINHNSICPH